MSREVDPYIIYCDGACQGNGSRVAGWGYVIIKDGDIIRYDSGRVVDDNPTNQKAELQAAIEAIKAAIIVSSTHDSPVFEVYSDSAYLINCINQDWWKKWIKNGWMTTSRQPVANQHYWDQLIPYFSLKNWTFHKAKGHSGDYYNDKADKLAQDACKIRIQGVKGNERLLI